MLSLQKLPVGLAWVWAEALGQPSFRAVAFIACMLSLLLHLQRKYLGYFCRGDVTVWLHEHLHGFEEVRAAGTSLRGGLRGATDPGSSMGGAGAWHPETGRRKKSNPRSGRECVPYGTCGIWGTGRHSESEPWENRGVQLSREVGVEV